MQGSRMTYKNSLLELTTRMHILEVILHVSFTLFDQTCALADAQQTIFPKWNRDPINSIRRQNTMLVQHVEAPFAP